MKMGRMKAHAVTVMGAVTSVIENLDDADVLIDILKRQVRTTTTATKGAMERGRERERGGGERERERL